MGFVFYKNCYHEIFSNHWTLALLIANL